MIHNHRLALRSLISVAEFTLLAASAHPQQTTLLVDIDHRPSISLNGAWHYIVDPNRQGWGWNPDKPNLDLYPKNAHYVPDGPLVQYDFEKSPTLAVPGDWNTQKDTLFYYEGLMWYQRDLRRSDVVPA